jgi:hypothetical protein
LPVCLFACKISFNFHVSSFNIFFFSITCKLSFTLRQSFNQDSHRFNDFFSFQLSHLLISSVICFPFERYLFLASNHDSHKIKVIGIHSYEFIISEAGKTQLRIILYLFVFICFLCHLISEFLFSSSFSFKTSSLISYLLPSFLFLFSLFKSVQTIVLP